MIHDTQGEGKIWGLDQNTASQYRKMTAFAKGERNMQNVSETWRTVTDMYIFLDGVIVPESQAVVSVYDHGFLYGDGVYETMRSYGGIVFMLRRHMDRLARSAALIRLEVPEPERLIDAVYQTLEANKLSDAYIRVTLSRGKGPIGLDPGLCGKHTLVVIAEQFREYPVSFYEDGVQFVIAKTRRNLADAINPKIKSLNFLNNILAKMEAKERGAYEAIMLSAAGFLTEGTVCNIFFVRKGILYTPSLEAGILDGITRELVVGLARREGIRVKEGLFLPNDLLDASEVFFTNTTAEVMPVTRVEGVGFEVGKITRNLHSLYKREVAQYVRNNK